MNTHDKLHKITHNGFKIYPVIKNKKFAVCIEDKRNVIYKIKKTVGEYKHTSKSINKAIELSLDYVFKKICNIK